MRRLGAFLILLATAVSASAEDWVTADGKTYKNVVIIAQEGDGVRVTYAGGVGKLPYYELPDDVVRRLGQDPAALAIKRAEFVKERAEAALQAKQDAAAAAELKRQADEAAAVAAALNPGQAPAATNASGQPAVPGQAATPNSTAAPDQSATPGQNSAPGQSAAPGQATASASSAPGGMAPQNTASGTNSAAAQKPGTAPAPGPAAAQNPAQAQNPVAAQNASPQPNFVPAHPKPPVAPPPPVAASSGNPAIDEQVSSYPNSKFQYDEGADTNYLDSPVVQIDPVVLDVAPSDTTPAGAAPPPPSPGASLYLHIATEGQRAETPDQVEGVFVSDAALKNLPADHKVKFLVDGAFIIAPPFAESTDDVAVTTDSQQMTRVTFLVTPDQMKTILSGKQVNMSVGSYDYRVGEDGIATFRAFLGDVNHLPPASTSLVRIYHRILNRLPSIITMISSTCEYIILGAFGVVLVAAIAAFIMGLTRFIKM